MHLAALVVVPGCIALAWWQVSRALGGNALSWVYSVEWPFFAGYALYMWWKLLHEDPGRRPRDRRGARPGGEPLVAGAPAAAPGPGPASSGDGAPASAAGAAVAAAGDPEAGDDDLDRYNRYLEALHTSGRRKRW